MTHEIVDNPLTEADMVTSETPMNIQADPASKKRKNVQEADVGHPQTHLLNSLTHTTGQQEA